MCLLVQRHIHTVFIWSLVNRWSSKCRSRDPYDERNILPSVKLGKGVASEQSSEIL